MAVRLWEFCLLIWLDSRKRCCGFGFATILRPWGDFGMKSSRFSKMLCSILIFESPALPFQPLSTSSSLVMYLNSIECTR